MAQHRLCRPRLGVPHFPPDLQLFALGGGKLTSPVALGALGVVVLWLPVGFGRREAPTGNGRGREERATGCPFLGFGAGSGLAGPSFGHRSAQDSSNRSPFSPSGLRGGRGSPALAVPRCFAVPSDFPQRCVHLCKRSLRLHRRESPLCHLLPAGTLGDVAVIGVAFSLRSVSDFLCGPTESAILPEPQFLYLLNEPTGPPAFPISEGRCENSMS